MGSVREFSWKWLLLTRPLFSIVAALATARNTWKLRNVAGSQSVFWMAPAKGLRLVCEKDRGKYYFMIEKQQRLAIEKQKSEWINSRSPRSPLWITSLNTLRWIWVSFACERDAKGNKTSTTRIDRASSNDCKDEGSKKKRSDRSISVAIRYTSSEDVLRRNKAHGFSAPLVAFFPVLFPRTVFNSKYLQMSWRTRALTSIWGIRTQ